MAIHYDGQGNYVHSAVCYIQVRSMDGTEFVPVKSAKPYNNDYGLDLFFLTKDVTSTDGKRKLSSAGSVVDGMTGIKLCNLEDFDACIKKHGIDHIRNMISSMVDKYGWSPRYLRPDEKKTDVFPKEEKDDADKCVMLTPLFKNGMFNRSGKRMRAKFVKTVSCDGASYDLYISGSKIQENSYPRSEDDKYYLHVLLNGWLIPLLMTERYLRVSAVWEPVVSRLYGDADGRDKLFNSLRGGRFDTETEQLIGEQLKKECALMEELEKDDKYMAAFIKKELEKHVQNFVACKNGTDRFPDFIGAVILGDVENCIRLSEIKKKKDAYEREKHRLEAEEQERQELAAEEAKRAAEIADTEEIMRNGGKIIDGHLICALADKYGISIPLRTRGWILSSFASCEISDDHVSVRYWKRKNSNGSTKIYDIIENIRAAVRE